MFMTFLTISICYDPNLFSKLRFLLWRTTCSVGITWNNVTNYFWRYPEPGAMSCSPQFVIALGFATTEAQIVLNRHNLFRSHLTGKANWCFPFDACCLISWWLWITSLSIYFICLSRQPHSWPIIPSLFSWFCNLTWSLDSSLGKRFWANLSFCGGAGVKIHPKNLDLWRWIPWWFKLSFEV